MEKLLKHLLKRPWLIISATVIITVIFFWFMKDNSRMETDLDEYMPKEHPAFVYSDMAEEWFGIKDGIIVAIENKTGIYNTETLDTLKNMTKLLQKMKQISRADVTSLYTADNITGTDLGLDVKPFYKRTPKTDAALEELRTNVESNEMANGRLVSEDGKVTVIIAEIHDSVFTQEFYEEILLKTGMFESKDIKIHVAGRPIVEGTMALLGPADMKRMVPIVIFVIMIVLYLMLRSFKSTLLTMLVVFLSVIWAFGLMAMLNIPIYAVTTMMPVMIIAIGVADGIHLFSHLQFFILKNPSATKIEAVTNMLRYMWKPVAITSITTSVGFISLLTSEVLPIKYFGVFTAFGVLSAMLFSLLLIPAGILTFGLPKIKEKTKQRHSIKWIDNFASNVIKFRPASIILTAIIIAVSIFGIQKVWINSSFLDKFERDSDIVLTDKFINENFGGTTTLDLILDAGTGNKDVFKKPEVLKLIDNMQKHVVNNHPKVGKSFSLADYINRMNKVMHADDESFNTIPETQELIAQYILLYEMSGDPKNLDKVVDYDYSKANVSFQMKSDNSKDIDETLALIDEYKEQLNSHNIQINYAGSGYTGLVFTDLILEGQIKSLILSLIIVIVLLGLMFKSIKAGLIGSVPITITAIFSFGIMGFLNIPLNTTTALLSSIAIGIGIDYAVHFLEQYRTNLATTPDKRLAAQKTMNHSGRAISYNAIVVIAGFMVLVFSVFPPNRELGALVSLNMFTSFLGTVTIMLALMYTSNIFKKK